MSFFKGARHKLRQDCVAALEAPTPRAAGPGHPPHHIPVVGTTLGQFGRDAWNPLLAFPDAERTAAVSIVWHPNVGRAHRTAQTGREPPHVRVPKMPVRGHAIGPNCYENCAGAVWMRRRIAFSG
jgi:hypothetical protein